MKIENTEYELLARYLSGEIAEKDVTEIESRIKADPEFAELVKRFRKVWEAKSSSGNLFDVKRAWEKLCKGIDIAESRGTFEVSNRTLWKVKNRSKSKHSGMNWLIRVAAMFLVAGLTALFMFMYMNNTTDKELVVMREVVTENGQRSNIHLKDGSRIILNSAGRITYASEFDDEVREIHLEGEAYFDIANDGRPFFVYADGAVVQVLGTEFNVRSYSREDIQIAVSDGLVAVKYIGDTDDNAVHLEKGDMASLPRDGEQSMTIRRNIDMKQYFGWLDYHYSYNNAPLGEIARELERTYGVDIEFVDPELSKLRLSANFEGDTIHEVLQVIQIILEMEYKVVGRKIFFSKKDPSIID